MKNTDIEQIVMMKFNRNEWGEFKAFCKENGLSPHGQIRKFVKTYLNDYEKNFKKALSTHETN